MTTIIFSAQALATLVALFYLYVLVIGFYRAHLDGRLTKAAFILAIPAIVVGFALDWFVNMTIASVWFLALPEKPLELVTDRLKRYIREDADDWRGKHARLICEHLLDYFDPTGRHC